MKKRSVFLNPISLFIIGLALGVMVRLFDIYTEHLGKMFSQMAIWILIGSAIAWYSPSAKKAMINILPFCLGMLHYRMDDICILLSNTCSHSMVFKKEWDPLCNHKDWYCDCVITILSHCFPWAEIL